MLLASPKKFTPLSILTKTHLKINYSLHWFSWAGIAQSVQRLATGMDGPGIESRWGRDFPHPSRPALGPTQPPVRSAFKF